MDSPHVRLRRCWHYRSKRKKERDDGRLIVEETVRQMLVRHARDGHSLSEIARRTGIPTSTVHHWSSKLPDFNRALAYGRANGACVRVIEAVLGGARTWEELESHTGLSENELGLVIGRLFSKKAIITKTFVSEEGVLKEVMDEDDHDVIDEIRLYLPGPHARSYAEVATAGEKII